MAVDRVERRLRRVAAALEAANVPYAIIGGNAVATWVGRVDPSATRATRDVDLLVQRSDLDALTAAMASLDFERHDLRRLLVFVDPEEPSRRAGVHVVWADERVRPSYSHPAPSVKEAVRDPRRILRSGPARPGTNETDLQPRHRPRPHSRPAKRRPDRRNPALQSPHRHPATPGRHREVA